MMWMIGLATATPPEIDEVLDSLHRAATEADADTYFGLFTPEAVFIGTDPTERWSLEAFRAFAAPHFQEAPAWDYRPVERHVSVVGRVAWFDEVLEHDRYGRVRGSGALVRAGRRWRVSQYVLSFAIPNEVGSPHHRGHPGSGVPSDPVHGVPDPGRHASGHAAAPSGPGREWGANHGLARGGGR